MHAFGSIGNGETSIYTRKVAKKLPHYPAQSVRGTLLLDTIIFNLTFPEWRQYSSGVPRLASDRLPHSLSCASGTTWWQQSRDMVTARLLGAHGCPKTCHSGKFAEYWLRMTRFPLNGKKKT